MASSILVVHIYIIRIKTRFKISKAGIKWLFCMFEIISCSATIMTSTITQTLLLVQKGPMFKVLDNNDDE